MAELLKTAWTVAWLLWIALVVGHLLRESWEIARSRFGYIPPPCRIWWCPQTWWLWLRRLLPKP